MGQFLVKAQDISKVSAAKSAQLLHKDFYLVEADDGLMLSSQVESCEANHNSLEMHDTAISIGTNAWTGLPDGYEWPRLRAVSRVYPLQTKFSKLTVGLSSTPELFIVDTGVNFTHAEFSGVSKINDFYKIPALESFRDELGHGTGMAAAAVGTNLGVFQNVVLQNVKINGTGHVGTLAEIGVALLQILLHHETNPETPKVVNCSWSVPKSAFLETVIEALISAGIVIVAAAGNAGTDISGLTPASTEGVITVAASDKDDVAAGFNDFSEADLKLTTNVGAQIDIFAPGVDVIVASNTGDLNYSKSSGTSISAALVSGAVAEIMAAVKDTFGADVKKILIDTATKGSLLLDASKFSATQNNLLYLLTADEAAQYANLTFYAETVSKDEPIRQEDITRCMTFASYAQATGETPKLVVKFYDTETETQFKDYITLDEVSCTFSINFPPNLDWKTDENMRLVAFNVQAVFSNTTVTSPKIIFFAINPNQTVDLTEQIATTLENLNAQSLLMAWNSTTPLK